MALKTSRPSSFRKFFNWLLRCGLHIPDDSARRGFAKSSKCRNPFLSICDSSLASWAHLTYLPPGSPGPWRGGPCWSCGVARPPFSATTKPMAVADLPPFPAAPARVRREPARPSPPPSVLHSQEKACTGLGPLPSHEPRFTRFSRFGTAIASAAAGGNPSLAPRVRRCGRAPRGGGVRGPRWPPAMSVGRTERAGWSGVAPEAGRR